LSFLHNFSKFLFIGRPTLSKGLPDLLLALGALRGLPWILTVVGDWGEIRPRELPPVESQCHLVGAVPHRDIPVLMNEADAIIVPSRYENFCNVALEAMAAGRAVLGSRCGGIPDLVEEGVTGLLFAPGVVQELELALRTAIRDPAELSRMGRSGWQKARRYSWNRIALETDALFRLLTEGGR